MLDRGEARVLLQACDGSRARQGKAFDAGRRHVDRFPHRRRARAGLRAGPGHSRRRGDWNLGASYCRGSRKASGHQTDGWRQRGRREGIEERMSDQDGKNPSASPAAPAAAPSSRALPAGAPTMSWWRPSASACRCPSRAPSRPPRSTRRAASRSAPPTRKWTGASRRCRWPRRGRPRTPSAASARRRSARTNAPAAAPRSRPRSVRRRSASSWPASAPRTTPAVSARLPRPRTVPAEPVGATPPRRRAATAQPGPRRARPAAPQRPAQARHDDRQARDDGERRGGKLTVDQALGGGRGRAATLMASMVTQAGSGQRRGGGNIVQEKVYAHHLARRDIVVCEPRTGMSECVAAVVKVAPCRTA